MKEVMLYAKMKDILEVPKRLSLVFYVDRVVGQVERALVMGEEVRIQIRLYTDLDDSKIGKLKFSPNMSFPPEE